MTKPSEPLVSIIILNYNAGKLLLDCLESICKITYSNLEIIVVDNASKDQSHLNAKEKFPKIRIIENKDNLGYCEGNNVGIRQATGDFIIILNPDTIVTPDCVTHLLDAYAKKGDALYQPKILSLYENNVIQSTGNMLHLFGFGFARDKGIPDNIQRTEIEKIGYASGTCLFTSKEVFKKVGLFDSFLFLYHDDLDLGWRAAQLGISSYYVSNATIFHAESYSLKWSSRKFFWLERNRQYCLLTHYSKDTYKKMNLSLFLVNIMVWLVYISKGFIASKMKADLEIKQNKKLIEEKQMELERKKIVPDNETIKFMPNDIFVPRNISNKISSRMFNMIISYLSKTTKQRILSNK